MLLITKSYISPSVSITTKRRDRPQALLSGDGVDRCRVPFGNLLWVRKPRFDFGATHLPSRLFFHSAGELLWYLHSRIAQNAFGSQITA
jgi:hypothetical protein